jgi:hypothetical protein
MKRLNSKGFSVVEGLLVVVILAAIGGVGWYIYNRNSSNSANTSTGSITNFQECKDAGNPVQESYPEKCTVNGQTYTNTNQTINAAIEAPQGWGQLNCPYDENEQAYANGKQLVFYPQNDKASGCDDRTNIILIDSYTGSKKCLSKAEVAEIQKTKQIKDYSCEIITINNNKITKEQGNFGGGPSISYSYHDKNVIVSYYANKEGTLPNASVVDDLVKTIQ